MKNIDRLWIAAGISFCVALLITPEGDENFAGAVVGLIYVGAWLFALLRGGGGQ